MPTVTMNTDIDLDLRDITERAKESLSSQEYIEWVAELLSDLDTAETIEMLNTNGPLMDVVEERFNHNQSAADLMNAVTADRIMICDTTHVALTTLMVRLAKIQPAMFGVVAREHLPQEERKVLEPQEQAVIDWFRDGRGAFKQFFEAVDNQTSE